MSEYRFLKKRKDILELNEANIHFFSILMISAFCILQTRIHCMSNFYLLDLILQK